MGVPAFFRWLSRKYPSIIAHCVEEKAASVLTGAGAGDATKIPIDTSKPNPNDYEFDNLYLDMNGIIHPCSHPENKPAPKNEAEMMVNIFEYIDRIFSIVRPRKLLYMAIDGVAPRAKMNQQRSRRFRAAKDSRESKEIINEIKQKLLESGALLPPEPEKKEHFDSNCITPGTDFMDRLSVCLRFYISDRLSHDPGWRNIKVILSDANVPGEGEHKIMDYIRKQRAQPDHNPNTKHCLNGADADLIMLGLATHELHFTIIREEFKPNQKRPCEICGRVGHDKADCEGLPKEKEGEYDDIQPFIPPDVEFVFIRLFVLREYLERELRMDGLPFYDFERVLDDWVFMCFFVGNDFLPHLPSLEIREGAIDRLVNIYKSSLTRMGGFITDGGFVDLKRVQQILKDLGQVEDEIFRQRQQKEENFKRRRQQQEQREKRQRMEGMDSPNWAPSSFASRLGAPQGGQGTSVRDKLPGFIEKLKSPAIDKNPQVPNSGSIRNPTPEKDQSLTITGSKRKFEEPKKEPEEPEDHIRLWEEGWKERYYLHKFSIEGQNDPEYYENFRKRVAHEYVLGLCWVVRYYFQGCPSWKWFYPFHYAPFASDFLNIEEVNTAFEKGTQPFKPLEQLMSVFPAASGKFLPPTWRELMSSPESELIDFYPQDFKIDLNGKKYAWQGTALLPFVDEKRLHRALSKVYGDLTEDEIRRNGRGHNIMFVGKGNSLFDFIIGLRENNMLEDKQDIVTDFSDGQRGKVFADDKAQTPGSYYKSPVPGVKDLSSVQSISVRYEDPFYDEDFKFSAKPLDGCARPEKILKPSDFPQGRQWTPRTGMGNHHRNPRHVSSGGQRMLRHELGNNRPRSPFDNMANQRFRSPGLYGTPLHSHPGNQWGTQGSYQNQNRSGYASNTGGNWSRDGSGSHERRNTWGGREGAGRESWGDRRGSWGGGRDSWGGSGDSRGGGRDSWGGSGDSRGGGRDSWSGSGDSRGGGRDSWGGGGDSRGGRNPWSGGHQRNQSNRDQSFDNRDRWNDQDRRRSHPGQQQNYNNSPRW